MDETDLRSETDSTRCFGYKKDFCGDCPCNHCDVKTGEQCDYCKDNHPKCLRNE